LADPLAPTLTPPWREAEPCSAPLAEPLPETEREPVEGDGAGLVECVAVAAPLPLPATLVDVE
jgi:hypothetical protein